MEQAIEQRERGELLTLQDRAQVKLDVGGASEARGVAQQAQALTVGDNPPELLGIVEVLLHESVGRETRAARGRTGIETVADALDMHRRRIVGLTGAVRDRVGAALHQIGAAVAGELIAQHAQQWQHPLLAGLGGGRLAGG